MQKVAIALLLVTLASAYTDTKTVLTELDADQFGNTLLSMVQVYMQSKGSSQEVNLLLNQLLAGILENQNKHDNLRRTEQAACNRITNDLQQTIAYHLAQVVANQALLDDNTAALADAEIDIRQTIKDIESNEATFAQEQGTRNGQNAVWTRKNDELVDAIAAVEEATKLVQHLALGTSFSQLKGRFDAVQKKLQENESHGALFQPIITALTELATQVDQKAIQQILQLLNQLRQQLVEQQNNLRDTEEKQSARWGEFSSHLTNEHNRLVDRRTQLTNAISSYHDNIQSAQHFLEVHQVEQEAAEDALAAQEAWCAHEEQDYETQSTERTRQQDIISRIQEHLIDKLSATQQYLEIRSGKF